MSDSSRKPDLQLPERPPRKFSFLLRCMETRTQMPAQSQPDSNWCFSLQDSKSDTVQNFLDFEALAAFLQSVLDGSQPTPKKEQGNDKDAP